jgi:hypothetical protein
VLLLFYITIVLIYFPQQITFNRTTNPESFVNASQGLFYLQVYVPANCSFYNVRTTDYRAYFLPMGSEIASLMVGLS